MAACQDASSRDRACAWMSLSSTTGPPRNRASERNWWQMLWLLAKGQTARAIARVRSPSWIGRIAKRCNAY